MPVTRYDVTHLTRCGFLATTRRRVIEPRPRGDSLWTGFVSAWANNQLFAERKDCHELACVAITATRRGFASHRKDQEMSAFLAQNGLMLLVFAIFLLPAIFSRRMERNDYLTLLAMPVITFFVAVLPGVIIWGFDKDAATYLLGVLIVITVATLNYRSQPKPHNRDSAAAPS